MISSQFLAGAGQAFEDAAVLGALLGEVATPADIDPAFGAYSAVRKERCQRVVDSSRGTGLIMCGQSPAGLDPAKIGGKLAGRWDFIAGMDLQTHKEEALAKMRALRGV